MLTTSINHQKTWPIIATVALVLLVWITSKWYYEDWFDNPLKYPAKAASLTATVLMCWCLLLSTRWRWLESFFGGLDKMYQLHKRLGRTAFYLIMLHPVFLAADKLPSIKPFLAAIWWQSPAASRYLVGQNVGVLGLLAMTFLMTVTLWGKLPYHTWKRSHEWFGLVMLLVLVHVVVVKKDVTAYPLLGLLIYTFLLLALASFIYIRFLYKHFGPRFHYAVSKIENVGDILSLTFSPLTVKMDFRPSQFVYLVVDKKGISPEPHPYSIACGYNLPSQFKLGIKKIGDHTRSLDLLEHGDRVRVYGPYGHFSDHFLAAERDCVFIGGGIGITPFLGMWHVALHSEERLDKNQVPEQLVILHPEIIKSWKSPRVALFYVCRTEAEATFDEDIRHEILISHYKGFTDFEKRGHHYELYASSQKGRITIEYINQKVRGGLVDKYIFLCGPSKMVESLIKQLQKLGIKDSRIIVEDFNLL